MKKIALLAVTCIVLCVGVKAQCNKNIKWLSTKSDYLDNAGNVTHSEDGDIEITTTLQKISMIVKKEQEEHSLNGDITDYTCNWKDKDNGKTSFKSLLTDDEGKIRHATITIETVEGKTTMLFEAEEEETKIKIYVDSFEEVK